ncbi:MAG: activator of HSP90 ATPase [Flammeovirgaceae bacterium]|nr:activator of HSP90 ATPase [Flammeovirgaceae bacterium]MBE60964.1 activator of HSP90 ATPase [Flammeovirgaceae bacterium]HCX22325.1 activator of HSP90 ATPase [Cytophagales bacterium]|tara:strand:- start:2469 stop:2882 length:414 start_codon:yes stop_codon:yes gene_type:complete
MSDQITITSTVKAAKSKAWEYYTSSEHITQWNFADPSWHCPSASNDMRVGGKYVARMEAKDGSFGFDFEAIYEELTPGESFTYVLGDGRRASVTFEEQGEATLVTVVFDPEKENPVEMQKGGWQAILNNYTAYTEAN